MMIKNTIRLYLLLIIGLIACQKKQVDTSTPSASDTSSAQEEIKPGFPPLNNQEVASIYMKADKVDIIFYNHPISVNQEDPASVKNSTLYVSPTSPRITARCNPLGRLTWMSEGKIIKEADIYCEAGCQYFLFIENNQPVYANAMSSAGITFFTNIITQAEEYKKNAK